MAEPGRTLRVTGLPTDIEEDRLKDKLLIHFMRTRNGGGEIDSVTIVKASPISALITYGDSGVAQRVIQHGRHILEVDGKKYKLTATEHCERPDPDQVILKLSATVDCKQLPGGTRAVTGLQRSHPDVQISWDKELCMLNGNYSKVQAALTQLIGHHGSPQSAESKDSNEPAPVAFRSVQTAHYTQESEYQSKKHHKQMRERENLPSDRPFDDSGSRRDVTPTGYGQVATAQTLKSVPQVPEHPATSEEDFSLMVDAEVFQYLQKHCQNEYQHILKTYGVELVEMTNQGLTTLFLQVANAGGEGGPEVERLKLSRKAIITLCQKNESKICRDQLRKSTLSPRGGLQRALENLSDKFPKVLLKEDEINIYIIGSSADVTAARQCLLQDFGKLRTGKDGVASLLGSPSHNSSSLNPAGEERAPFHLSSHEETLDDRMNDILRSEEDEKRGEVPKRYKLAARFKDSGIAALGNRPTDSTFRGHSSSSRQMFPGHDVLPGATGYSGERLTRVLALDTGQDILFKSGNHLPSISPLSATQSSSSGRATLSPAGSGSPLRRASSFSGSPQHKAQLTGHRSKDDSSKSIIKSPESLPSTTQSGLSGHATLSPAASGSPLRRASSFSGSPQHKAPLTDHRRKDDSSTCTERDVHRAEIRVSQDLWTHIKEAYRYRMDDLTSDVQVKESKPENDELTVTVRGATTSIVTACEKGLQKLIESVRADFLETVLPFSELGVTSPTDETLEACCNEVRSRFKKVTISLSEKNLILFGPRLLCSQVAAILQEVFSGDLSQIPEQQTFSSSAPSCNPSSFSHINEDQITSLRHYSNAQVMPEGKTGGGPKRSTNHTSDFSQTDRVNGSANDSSVRIDAVIKEKVKLTAAVESNGQNHWTAGYDKSEVKHATGVGSTTGHSIKDVALQSKGRTTHSSPNESREQAEAGFQGIPEESRSRQRHLDHICVGCQKALPIVRSECGVRLCSQGLDTFHAHCRVCRQKELPRQGIRGKMSNSVLQLILPGHAKDFAIKITYNIPDGIQAEGHPSPGKPFQGGVFEAYLPDCDAARKLLPRLEKAFRQGLTFTVEDKGAGARVRWNCIPHKTTINGGKSGCGYPDTTYLSRLSQVLTSHGIR